MVDYIRDEVGDYFRGREAEKSSELIQPLKEAGVYPYEGDPKDEIERRERQVLDVATHAVQSYSGDFKKAENALKKIILGLDLRKERIGTMARTAKKTKAVTVATVENAAADAEIRSVGEVAAEVVAVLPAPEPESAVTAEAETVADTVPVAEVATGTESGFVSLLEMLNANRKNPHGGRRWDLVSAQDQALHEGLKFGGDGKAVFLMLTFAEEFATPPARIARRLHGIDPLLQVENTPARGHVAQHWLVRDAARVWQGVAQMYAINQVLAQTRNTFRGVAGGVGMPEVDNDPHIVPLASFKDLDLGVKGIERCPG